YHAVVGGVDPREHRRRQRAGATADDPHRIGADRHADRVVRDQDRGYDDTSTRGNVRDAVIGLIGRPHVWTSDGDRSWVASYRNGREHGTVRRSRCTTGSLAAMWRG